MTLLFALAGCAQRAAAPLPPGILEDEVVFTRYSPLARAEEIARRTLTPLTLRHGRHLLSAKGLALREQTIDLAREKFTVYLPGGPAPARGYGLLVFIAPWSAPTRPQIWRPPLDRHGLIFVSASNSGNDTPILDRRLPLALHAVENVQARHPVDGRRVFVGGLSGGSRAAEVTALAYPDVFRGALLNAGSDPIGGERGIYLPPADLFRKFQETRLVFVTGEHDQENLHDDDLARASLADFCVFDLKVLRARGLGHEPLDGMSIHQALDALDQAAAPDAAKLARCNARVQEELGSRLSEAEAALARADRDEARARLAAIDGHFGGLAAPAIFHLDDALQALPR